MHDDQRGIAEFVEELERVLGHGPPSLAARAPSTITVERSTNPRVNRVLDLEGTLRGSGRWRCSTPCESLSGCVASDCGDSTLRCAVARTPKCTTASCVNGVSAPCVRLRSERGLRSRWGSRAVLRTSARTPMGERMSDSTWCGTAAPHCCVDRAMSRMTGARRLACSSRALTDSARWPSKSMATPERWTAGRSTHAAASGRPATFASTSRFTTIVRTPALGGLRASLHDGEYSPTAAARVAGFAALLLRGRSFLVTCAATAISPFLAPRETVAEQARPSTAQDDATHS
jgi:hypothetical protein